MSCVFPESSSRTGQDVACRAKSGRSARRSPHGEDSSREETEVVLGAISGLEFLYTHKDDRGRIVPWKSSWQVSDALPAGVKVTLVVGETRFTKLVFMPHGFKEEPAKP